MTTHVRTSAAGPDAEPTASSTVGSLPVLFSLPSLTDSDSLTSGTLMMSGRSDRAGAMPSDGVADADAGFLDRSTELTPPLAAAAPASSASAAVAMAERRPANAPSSAAALPDWLSHWSGGLGVLVSLLVVMVIGIVFIRGARLDSSGSTARLMEELSEHLTDEPQVQLPQSEPSYTAVTARSGDDLPGIPAASGRLISQLRDRYGSESPTVSLEAEPLVPQSQLNFDSDDLPGWASDVWAPAEVPSAGRETGPGRAADWPAEDFLSEPFPLEPLGPAGESGTAPTFGEQGLLPTHWGPVAQLGQPISQAPVAGSRPAGRLEGVEADTAAVVGGAASESPARRSTEPTARRIFTETEYAHLSVQELLALRQQAQQQLARDSSLPGTTARPSPADSLSPPMGSPGYHSAARPTMEAGQATGQSTSQGFGDQQPLTHPSLTR